MKINSDMTYLLAALVVSGILFAVTREKELIPIVAGSAAALGAIAQSDARTRGQVTGDRLEGTEELSDENKVASSPV